MRVRGGMVFETVLASTASEPQRLALLQAEVWCQGLVDGVFRSLQVQFGDATRYLDVANPLYAKAEERLNLTGAEVARRKMKELRNHMEVYCGLWLAHFEDFGPIPMHEWKLTSELLTHWRTEGGDLPSAMVERATST